jgi:uncharacterized membrane protein YqgA involved in biofilm formation
MVGLGTLYNVAAILVGSALGVWFGHRLPERTSSWVCVMRKVLAQ